MHIPPPPPRPRNPGRIPRLNQDGQPPGGGRRVHRYSSERQQGMAGRIPNGFNLQFQSRQNWGLLRRGHWPVLHLWPRKVGYKPYTGHFLPLCQTKLKNFAIRIMLQQHLKYDINTASFDRGTQWWQGILYSGGWISSATVGAVTKAPPRTKVPNATKF